MGAEYHRYLCLVCCARSRGAQTNSNISKQCSQSGMKSNCGPKWDHSQTSLIVAAIKLVLLVLGMSVGVRAECCRPA